MKIRRSLKAVSVLMILAMVFALAACGGSTGASANSPAGAIKSYFDAIHKADIKEAQKYTTAAIDSFEGSTEAQIEAMSTMMKYIGYTILSTEENGDQATVKVKVIAPDMGAVMGVVLEELMDSKENHLLLDDGPEAQANLEEKIMEAYVEKIKDPKIKKKETEVMLSMVKKNSRWRIEENAEFASAMTGNTMQNSEESIEETE